MSAFGRLDVIVGTVGGGAGSALYPAESYPEDEWDRIMDLNLRSIMLPANAAVRAILAGGRGGSVLHFSSVRGQLGIDNGFSAYVAAKGALDALTRRKMQDELLQLWDDIRFTVVFVTHSIEEAVIVGSRILVLSSHPGQVRAELNSPGFAFHALVQRIDGMLFGIDNRTAR